MTDALLLTLRDIAAAVADLERVNLGSLPPLVAAKLLLDAESIRAQLAKLADTSHAYRHSATAKG